MLSGGLVVLWISVGDFGGQCVFSAALGGGDGVFCRSCWDSGGSIVGYIASYTTMSPFINYIEYYIYSVCECRKGSISFRKTNRPPTATRRMISRRIEIDHHHLLQIHTNDVLIPVHANARNQIHPQPQQADPFPSSPVLDACLPHRHSVRVPQRRQHPSSHQHNNYNSDNNRPKQQFLGRAPPPQQIACLEHQLQLLLRR